jgi:hypothetical protein
MSADSSPFIDTRGVFILRNEELPTDVSTKYMVRHNLVCDMVVAHSVICATNCMLERDVAQDATHEEVLSSARFRLDQTVSSFTNLTRGIMRASQLFDDHDSSALEMPMINFIHRLRDVEAAYTFLTENVVEVEGLHPVPDDTGYLLYLFMEVESMFVTMTQEVLSSGMPDLIM